MKNKDKPKLKDIITAIIVIGALLWAILFGYVKNKDIDNNREFTTGKITGIKHLADLKYSIEYEYLVDSKKYKGTVSVNHFECTRANRCIGYKIDVFFSSKNHQNSQAYLKKYDNYRTQVYFP